MVASVETAHRSEEVSLFREVKSMWLSAMDEESEVRVSCVIDFSGIRTRHCDCTVFFKEVNSGCSRQTEKEEQQKKHVLRRA